MSNRPRIDKSTLTFGEPQRITDKAWRQSARGRACDTCGIDDGTVVFAHLATSTNSGMGLKPTDPEGLFLCGPCHYSLDTSYDRAAWVIDSYVIPQMHKRYRKWKATQ